MPIDSNASYPLTMAEFAAHWQQVNFELNPDLLIVTPDKQSMTQAEFVTLRQTLEASFIDLVDRLNDVELARAGIRAAKATMLVRLNELLAYIDSYWAPTLLPQARPLVPSVTDGPGEFLKAMYDAMSLWERMNEDDAPAGITLPVVLADGTTQADFRASVLALNELYADERSAIVSTTLSRAQRDAHKARAYAVMKAYRQAVPARCAGFPILLETLPALSPKPGHTPDPVNVSAVFVPPDQSRVAYTPSDEPSLLRYELRGHPGDEYDAEDAVVVATNAPADAPEFLTAFGLTQPGTRVAFKVYVVLQTGNVAGSAAVVVERPADE